MKPQPAGDGPGLARRASGPGPAGPGGRGPGGAGPEAAVEALLPLLEDANDDVKYQVVRTLPRLAGPTPAMVDGLCRRLLKDVSPWVRETAAQALGPLGRAAAAAGGAHLWEAQTGEVAGREQALRALAMIQPPEAAAAFTAGIRDGRGAEEPAVRELAAGLVARLEGQR